MIARPPRKRREINWDEMRLRLEAVARDLELERRDTGEAATQLLRARARRLAQPSQTVEAHEATRTVVAFSLGNETYAIEAGQVLGAFRLTDLAPLPGAPAGVVGLTFWRGDLLVVLDIRPLLGLQGPGLDDLSWILAIGDDRHARGLLAGSLHDVLVIPEQEITPADRDLGGPATAGRLGITRDAIQLLDGHLLLDIEV